MPAQLDLPKEIRVLLAGDCFISLATVANLLQWFSIKSDLCQDKEKALELVKRSQATSTLYNLIFVDVNMTLGKGP